MRPLLAALCFLLVHLAYAEAEHQCGHILPERFGYTSTTSSRTRRQATAREPIRIVPVYYEEDFNRLPSSLSAKYKSVVVEAINYLSSFLKVDRLTQNIKLQRFCNISTLPGAASAQNPYDHCTTDMPCMATFCVLSEYLIPEDHLKACKTCETPGSTNCSTDGQDGPGVADADFVVYVAARPFGCGPTTLAYAAHCYLDKKTDRPIAGVVNLCPGLEYEQDMDNIVLTVTHELTHALNEGMTGVISTNGVFSRLTFALYEDSGWYDVDYSVASPLRFGRCLGCDFAEKSCFSYGLDKEPFCDSRKEGANSSCTYDHVAIAACDLVPLSIPIQYQYFSDPDLGGIEETMDYCPVHRARSPCQHPRNLSNNVFMESVGPNSKCVDFEIMTNWEYNSITIPPIHGGACYEVSCASEGAVAITVGQTMILCQSVGQEVIVPAMGFDIVIICPGFEDICWENSTTCPATTSALPSTPSSTLSSAPPSGLSTDRDIAIGVIFGLPGLVNVAVIVVVVVLVMMYKHCRRGKKSFGGRGRSAVTLEAYTPIATDLIEGLVVEEKA